VARIAEWTLGHDGSEIDPDSERVLLDIPQPESNHNGGALVFGADGFLYIAVGDGEDGEWVTGRAKREILRGKILRIDVDHVGPGRPYGIPPDNPLVADPAFPPETFAWGFRNPWRLAFAPDGRLIAGDVGEDVHEEITTVQRGRHHGWPAMEGNWCRLEQVCDPETSVGPLFQYGREAGMSVTGGEVYEGDRIGWLNGAYLFADFSSGWIWSIDLPDRNRLIPPDEVTELGRWTVEFTAFAKAPDGEVYVGDLRGRLYRLAPLSVRAAADKD
jgi:glucose/arabinose dehydrogenase